ncbi:cytochrome P450 4C1-like [Macrobrachium rosenbergii]|uniref:cytochrome P450 4C1-like n=1 Tax=Macrobrachium rosenbergii TaxID=79674 RepID=UPI0034D5B088
MNWTLEQTRPTTDALIYFFFTLLLGLLSHWFIKRQKRIWAINKLPGPRGLPIIGNALEMALESKELFEKLNSFGDYGDISKIWLGNQPVVFISGAQATEAVLSSSRLLEKNFAYYFLHPWLGAGLLTSSGQKWHSRRKLLTPAFHFKILEDFVEVFNAESLKMVAKLRARADGEPFNAFPYVTRCTLDIICETAMGTSINAQDDEGDNTYVNAIYKIGYMTQQRVANAWQHSDLLYWLSGYAKERDSVIKITHDFSLKTIRERRKLFQERTEKSGQEKEEESNGPKKRLAFLDLLLEYSKKGEANLSDEDIREEVDTFMFEGHDTTTAAINWSLFLLGLHPEVQSKVHEELDSVFGDSDRPVTTEDLRNLKYLENCIKEALRIFPSVPFFGREVREDIVIGDFHIPADTSVTILTYRLHRDPKYFQNPEVFDPDRFLPENSRDRHPFAYVPFSAGPRNCIGQKFAMMEEKVILSHVLRNFRVESQETRGQVEVLGELILRPAKGNHLKLYPRSKRPSETLS